MPGQQGGIRGKQRRHRIAPIMQVAVGQLKGMVEKRRLDAPLRILGSFTLPTEFSPCRMAVPLDQEESAVGVIVTPFKVNWTAQPDPAFQQLVPAEMFVAVFPDNPLRKRVYYQPNYQNAFWSYDWTYQNSKNLVLATSNGWQCLAVSWAEPSIVNGVPVPYQPHTDHLYSGYDEDDAKYIWVDQVNRGVPSGKSAATTYSKINLISTLFPNGTSTTSSALAAVFGAAAAQGTNGLFPANPNASSYSTKTYVLGIFRLWRDYNDQPFAVDQRVVQLVCIATSDATPTTTYSYALAISANGISDATNVSGTYTNAAGKFYFGSDSTPATGYSGFIASDYYNVEVTGQFNAVSSLGNTYEAGAASFLSQGIQVTSSGYCSNLCHVPVESIHKFIPRMNMYRSLADSLLMTNMAALLNPEGEIAMACLKKPNDWYDFFSAAAGGNSIFNLVADYKGHFLGRNQDGGYFWCAPHNPTDMEYQEKLWHVDKNGIVIDTKYPLKPPRPVTVMCISTLNDGNNTGQQGSGLGADFWGTHTTSMEYLTDDLLTEVAFPDEEGITTKDWDNTFDYMKHVDRFHSNRLHWADIIGSIGKALQWGKPYIMGALGMGAGAAAKRLPEAAGMLEAGLGLAGAAIDAGAAYAQKRGRR